MSKLCPTCGMISDDTSTICSHCGTPLPDNGGVNNVVEAVTTPIEEIETLDLNENVQPEVVNTESVQFAEPVVESLNVDAVEVPAPVTEVPVVETGQVQEINGPVVEEVAPVETIEPVITTSPAPVEEIQSETIVEVTPTVEQTTAVEEVAPESTPVVEEPQTIENPTEPVVESLNVGAVEVPAPVTEVPVVETVQAQEINSPVVEEVAPVETIEPVITNFPAPVEEIQSETIVEVTPTVEQTTVVEEVAPESTPTVEEPQTIETPTEPVEEQPKSKAILDANTVIDIPEGMEEVSAENIVNEELESVSIQVEQEVVPQEEVIQEVVLPEATVGEIDTNELFAMYAEAEKKNEDNKVILAKQEEERIAREEAERLAKQKQVPKPDLMARTDFVVSDEDMPSSGKRKKKKSFLPKFFIILILMLMAAGIYWYFFARSEKSKEDTYNTPIEEYYKALNKQDKTGVLNTYVPCTRKDENINNELDVYLATLKDYKSLKIEYRIVSVEVVNSTDQTNLSTTTLGTYCGVDNLPTITNYKHIYVEQTLVTEERTTNNVEFWVVQIDDKWYIIPITENI